MLGGVIEGLEGRFEVWRARLRPGRANLRPGRANLRPRWSTGGGRTEGRKDGRLKIPPCVLQDIGPLGPLPKKVNLSILAGAVMN